MSDSDSELLTTNTVFPFQNESTTISARGPNINTSNLTGISFRNNVLTSTMNMPRNYEWKSRAVSNHDQRSQGYRRGTSPMSIVSACDARQRNFNSSYYGRGMSSQRSVHNGRGGSPMSMRSIDSNATMSATDIAMAFKTNQFNKYDMRIIKEAYTKFMKQKSRKRIEKRRNLKLFLKGYRRKSGYDSGELGSNSSISSDDNRSTRTANYKTNLSSCRSTKTDLANFRKTIKESHMFNDCTDNIRQNTMHGMNGRPENLNTSRSSVSSFRSIIEMPSSTKPNPPQVNFNKTQSQSSVTQQDRFKNGFLLPSQRFNRSVAASSIPEVTEKPHQSQINKYQNVKNSNRGHPSPSKCLQELNSDDEEIFSENTAIARPTINQRKRSFNTDDDEICLPVQKKSKVASPCKSSKNSTIIENTKKDFQFAKPAFPVRKSANVKSKEKNISNSVDMSTTEKLISKSRAPFSDINIQPLLPQSQPINFTSQQKEDNKKEQTDKEDIVELSAISQNATDQSMRQSFIKRKLFTQNMDVTEKTNEVLAANSPLNSHYGAIQKEKNKARKFTSQFCLSRDIQSDTNNLLDLIHKIVPSEKMNATNLTNKTAVQNNNSEDNDDKWDVTSIISTRNNDEDISDTFTDEDATVVNSEKLPSSPKVAGSLKKKSAFQISEKKVGKSPSQVIQKVLVDKNGTPKKMVQKYVKSFWDTDFESDVEGTPAMRKEDFKENKSTEKNVQYGTNEKFQGFSSIFPANKTSMANNFSINTTIDSVQKFTNRSLKLCSHRNNKPTAKKGTIPTQEKIKENAKSCIEPQNKKTKPTKSSSCLDITTQKNNELNHSKTESPEQEKRINESKIKPPKIKKAIKETTNKDKTKHLTKKQNGNKQDNKILKSDELKLQNTKPVTINKKPEKGNELNTTQNKPFNSRTKSNTTSYKNEANEIKNQNNKRIDVNNKPQCDSDNIKIKDQKSNSTQKDSVKKNKKKNNQNSNKLAKDTSVYKLPNSIIYEDSFNETNNNKSIRPVRSCRNSKQKEICNTTGANHTLSMSLRSRDLSITNNNSTEKSKPAKYLKKVKSTKNDQSTLSDFSFSITQVKSKKPLSSISNTRLFKTKDIDTSDVSFSINNDKDSPLHKSKQGNSARINTKLMNRAVITLTPIDSKMMLTKDVYLLNKQRPLRNKLANRRYVS